MYCRVMFGLEAGPLDLHGRPELGCQAACLPASPFRALHSKVTPDVLLSTY